MQYIKINNLLGWFCFLTAAITYALTLEPTASFWDCGEFIASAYKLQVVHQPGAPLFIMIAKVFSLLASDKTQVAFWMNMSSALASAATILFLFWTITALARKVLVKNAEEISNTQLITIMGSGLVGALAYTFSDTFWFSAVEAEVYALSSLCTAIVFWAILKWDHHASDTNSDKWLIFIAYIMGLSIGVHLLNLLAIPAIAIVYYFRRTAKPTSQGTLFALLIGIVILGVIQYGIIQYLVKFAAFFDLFFVNTLGMGFGSGVFVFALIIIGGITYGIMYSIRKAKPILNLALICTVFILMGYSSYAMIVIRAKADPTLNNSDPDNVFALLSYLNREQYGDRPLLYGQYYDSQRVDYKETGTIYRKGKDKYEEAGKKYDYVYDKNTLLPRPTKASANSATTAVQPNASFHRRSITARPPMTRIIGNAVSRTATASAPARIAAAAWPGRLSPIISANSSAAQLSWNSPVIGPTSATLPPTSSASASARRGNGSVGSSRRHHTNSTPSASIPSTMIMTIAGR